MNVLIAYDDPSAYTRAIRTLVRLSSQLDEDLPMQPLPWHFGCLEQSDWRARAMADASKSDMLMVATSGPSGLTRSIQAWLEACLALKRNTATAVVALLGGSGESDLQFLRQSAGAAGLEFFAPAPVTAS